MTEQAQAEDNDETWSQWFDVLSALCREVGKHVEEATAGRSDQFGAALVAGLIEDLAERLRVYLKLPASDLRPEVPG